MPQAVGELIIAGVNYAIAEIGGAVASEAFIAPFATTGFYAEVVGTIAINAATIGISTALVGEGRVIIPESE